MKSSQILLTILFQWSNFSDEVQLAQVRWFPPSLGRVGPWWSHEIYRYAKYSNIVLVDIAREFQWFSYESWTYKGVAMSTTGSFWNAKLHIKQCFPPQRYSSSRPWRNLRCSKAGFRVVNGFFLIIDATTFLSHALLLCFFCPCRAQCSGTGCAVLSKHVMPYEINSICNVHKNDRTGASERWIQNRFPGSFWWDGEFRPFRRRVVSCVGGPLGPAIIANTAFVHIHASKQSKLHTYHEVIAIRFRGCTLSAEPDRWGRCGNPCRGSHRWVQRGETQRWQEKRCRFLNLRCLGYDHKLTSPQRNRASIRTSMLA